MDNVIQLKQNESVDWALLGPRIDFMVKNHNFRVESSYDGTSVTCSILTKNNYLFTVTDTSLSQAIRRCWLAIHVAEHPASTTRWVGELEISEGIQSLRHES